MTSLPTHPCSKQSSPPKKRSTKSHRFMGAGLNLGGGMQSGESRGRGDGEGPEQVTLRGEGKADGRQGFFLEGRHSPLPGWARSQQIPPRLSRPEVGASASSGPWANHLSPSVSGLTDKSGTRGRMGRESGISNWKLQAWPKSLLGIFQEILWENPNELSG